MTIKKYIGFFSDALRDLSAHSFEGAAAPLLLTPFLTTQFEPETAYDSLHFGFFLAFLLIPSAVFLGLTWIWGVWSNRDQFLVGELFVFTWVVFIVSNIYVVGFINCLFDAKCSVWDWFS